MSDQTRLSDLCSICNINKSKYRCPGCSARTCSLSCYKRHQQWAQCSGQRDPTKFVKKSQLVTPAGIDHDFNFLTGIEQDIEKAENDFNKNVDIVPARSTSWSRSAQKGQVNYQQLEASGVKVIRAPTGLSRQKENKSRRSSTKKSTGGKNLTWTVEWFDDQRRRVITETSSTSQIAAAQPFTLREQHKGKKRKRNTDVLNTSDSTKHQDDAPASEDQNRSVQLDIEVIDKERQHSSTRQRPSNSDEQAHQATNTQLAEAHPRDDRGDGPSTQPMGDGQYRFFLLKPRTSSSRHVLIPLTSTATLGECLHGRTILEFPTIYVFSSPVLPEGFMLEEDYHNQEGEELREFGELIKELDPEIVKRLQDDGRRTGGRIVREEEVDSKAILDVLKKDFGTGL